ncbi:cilia- and flagella-associated protein 54 [Tachyglossus aculeatus]|uniref:cilia- and flagella-associated protein 54 n=1 Tax=Tachyglossus aculeatus TaxID=9261 RepID=UPI0018F376C5|nr:cilia- and flagella-associated protein 54 [Tachyglossus aculeatus]
MAAPGASPTATPASTEPGQRAPPPLPRPGAPGPAARCPPGAAFYGPLDEQNPLLASCSAHCRHLLALLSTGGTAAAVARRQLARTGATSLFNIWTKFESRLPAAYYNEKLLKVGESLMQIKEYKLALTQCYGRYLQQFNAMTFDERKADVDEFKAIYFPEGLAHKSVSMTFQALQGRSICSFHMVCANDINLQNEESVRQSLNILSSLRLTMQVALPQEHLCWIVYNGTIHIYTICRKLMSIGQSKKALEYLLWSSICMESSIPLLSVNYLTWRTVLYTAVCQCYFDCQEGLQGEVFARRALSKIDELRTLEMMSSSPPQAESKNIYKEATIKMAVMIFKRAVYEPRRKPKGFLRPKVRVNLKEVQTLQWPRTVTERLLTEMFDSTASQFLAILEALSDSNRRTLQTGPPTVDEIEVRDVVLELFMAGLELLTGGPNGPSLRRKLDFSQIIHANSTQLQLIIEGKNAISADAAVRFIKLAFTYEDWNLFNSTADLLINFLKSQDDSASKKSEMDLKLLVAMEPLVNVKRLKGTLFSQECFRDGTPRGSGKKTIAFQDVSKKTVGHSDELIHLAATLLSCVRDPSQNIQPDREIVIDIIMFLWQKYKVGVERMSISGDMTGYDSLKFTQKTRVNKWVHLLWLINEILQCCKMENVDIVVVAEAALRLSEILEHVGYLSRKRTETSDNTRNRPSSEVVSSKNLADILPIIQKSPEEQLLFAYENFNKAIDSMNVARSVTSLPNGLSAFDHCYTKKLNTSEANGSCNTPVTANSFVMDLHLELIQAQHRIAVMLLNQTSGFQTLDKDLKPTKSSVNTTQSVNNAHCLTESDVMNTIKKNKLSKAIFLMQKAELIFQKQLACVSPNHLLEEAFSLIQKTEAEQSALYSYQKKLEDLTKEKNRIPPPPILLSRSYNSMTFKPAPFTSGVKVSWYRILGCKADGCSGKVRLNNDHLSNSGEMIPADGKSILEVKDLEANEKYIFAVAAYSSDGKLVGNAVGETTKPILAYSPLSTITVRTFLTQVAYQIGSYTLAKRAFSPIWDYFVSIPSSPSTNISVVSLSSKLSISQFRLIPEILSQTSSILLYLFLRSIFITSDIIIKEKNLFCDAVCGNDMYCCQQVGRLAECERLLVAIELSTWLNDANYVLQAVVQCYGLLAPIIYHNIALVPVIQVLIKCLAVLQEIPGTIFVKKQTGTFESIQHMIACSVFYTAKVLRSWKEYELAVIIINYGKKMLDSSGLLCTNLSTLSKSSMIDDEQDDTLEEGAPTKKSLKKKTQLSEKISEQLNILENNMLKLTKQHHGSDLLCVDDPIFLYPIVFNWTTKCALREVMKFKHRPRFLEFLVQVMQKSLNEEKFFQLLEWSGPIQDFLKRRNDTILGNKKTPIRETPGNLNPGEDVSRPTTASTEFSRSVESTGLKKTSRMETAVPTKRRQSREFYTKRYSSQEFEKYDGRKMASKCLIEFLSPFILYHLKRKKLHQLFTEEMPWRSQMNIYLAMAHFNVFRKQLEDSTNIKVCNSQNMISYQSLDPDLFSLCNSGSVLVEASNLNLENYKMIMASFLPLKKRKDKWISDCPEFFYPGSNVDEVDSPQVHVTNDSDPSHPPILDPSTTINLLDHFSKIFLHLRRAVVLAHRGRQWTLLQNACRLLWNYSQDMHLLVKHADQLQTSLPINTDVLTCALVLPFYFASDMLLDMVVDLQNTNSVKIVDEQGDFNIPSCFGSIGDDEGGSKLTFEQPLDDVTVVDFRWTCDFVLKTLQILYQVEKWETLIHIAVQFNSITHEKYTGQVTPLLVHAQRQLIERVQAFGGPDIPQPHFVKFVTDHKEKITCRNYIDKQLRIATTSNEVINPESLIDHEGSSGYSDIRQASRLVCVPLDLTDTLKCFRETLGKSKYHSRSLRHSRKLLSLLLAQTQETSPARCSPGGTVRKVEFSSKAEQTHLPTPPDLSQEKFISPSTVESKGLPHSQIAIVISSYEKTIELLHATNQTGLKVQALHELGNLLFFTGNKRMAFKCWCQALDGILRKSDVLNTWKEFNCFSVNVTDNPADAVLRDYSEKFLFQAGIWGCLQGAVIAAKLAQYILTSNMRQRTECCILSAFLFKALFRSSLPHPKVDYDFAQYEITKLAPGIDLFSDRYRADVSTVVASLTFLICELHFAKQNLITLPLFTLYQYFVSEICQDPLKCIEGRILKMQVLIDLGFFADAFNELSLLYSGKNIPCKVPSGYKSTGKLKQPIQKFETDKSLLSKENLAVIDDLLNKGLPVALASLCSQQILNKLFLARMHFLISLAAMINGLPEKVLRSLYCASTSLRNKSALLSIKEVNSRDQIGLSSQLIKCKEDLTLNMLKGILLSEAEDRLNLLVADIQDGNDRMISQCSAVELEVVIEAKLQLAAIAQQRHQAAFSAAIAFSVLQTLQDAEVFKEIPQVHRDNSSSPPESESVHKEDTKYLEPSMMVAREHLDIRLWLRCRLVLLAALVAQIRGIVVMKENETAECLSLIDQMLREARASGDVEIEAEIMVQTVVLNLQERRPKANTIQLLQDIIHLLEEKPFISPQASLIFVQSILLLDDLMKMETEDIQGYRSLGKEKLNYLILSHKLIIEQILTFGETVEWHKTEVELTTPLQPLKNIYLPHINLLAKVKLRLGYELAKQVACTAQRKDPSKWLPALQLLRTALELCRASAVVEFDLEAEILFQKGKVERQLFLVDNPKPMTNDDFFEAIKLSQRNDQNYGMIRKSYLEIALFYFHLAAIKNTGAPLKSQNVAEQPNVSKVRISPQFEKHSTLAWIAIRAATQVNEAMVASQLLIGKKSVKEHPVNYTTQIHIPQFAYLDLLTSYTDYLNDGHLATFKNPLFPSTPNEEVSESLKKECRSESEVKKINEDQLTVTWVHLVRYHNHLMRLNNMGTLLASSKPGSGMPSTDDALYTSVFNQKLVLRLREMHYFLKLFLHAYSFCCVEEFPKDLLQGLEKPAEGEKTHGSVVKIYHGSTTVLQNSSSIKLSAVSSFFHNLDSMTESRATYASNKELCFQWYIPPLEVSAVETEPKVLLLFAYNTKKVKILSLKTFNPTNIFSGHLWIHLKRVLSLYEKLSHLKQQAEISLPTPTDISPNAESEILSSASKIEMEKSEIEEKVKECCTEVKCLLLGVSDTLPLTEVPFDISLESISNLKKLFDLANGCVLLGGSIFQWITSLLT